MKRLLSVLLVTGAIIFIPILCIAQSELSELSDKVEKLSDILTFVKEGSILSTDGDTVYIDLGLKDNILSGNKFKVARLGEPLLSDGHVLGFKEILIGEVEIERVGDKFSIARVISKTGDIEKGDVVFQQHKKIKKIAITEFSSIRGKNAFTNNLYDLLHTSFIQKGIKVSDRDMLDDILINKIQHHAGNKININTALELGKALEVEGVVIGNISNLGDTVAIRARLVDIEQGDAITAGSVEIANTPAVSGLLSRSAIEVSLDKGKIERKVTEENIKPKKRKIGILEGIAMLLKKRERKGKYFQVDDLFITVKSFKKTSNNIEISLLYENTGETNIPVKMQNVDSIYLVDENNQRWNFQRDSRGVEKWGKALMKEKSLLTSASFTPSGKTDGRVFTLHITHTKPRKFKMVIYDLPGEQGANPS